MTPCLTLSPNGGKGDQPDEADVEILEPPGKKIRFSLEERFEKLMDRTQEGFDLTRGVLEKVQLHLDMSKKVSQDLSQLAREVHREKIGAKYQLAQLQQVLSSFQNWNGRWAVPRVRQTPASKVSVTKSWELKQLARKGSRPCMERCVRATRG